MELRWTVACESPTTTCTPAVVAGTANRTDAAESREPKLAAELVSVNQKEKGRGVCRKLGSSIRSGMVTA